MKRVNINFSKALAKNKKFEKNATDLITNKFEKAQETFLNEFNSSSITKEIESGPSAANISNTLGGIGNLFSFIGFRDSDNPIEELRDFIKNNFRLSKKRKSTSISFEIEYPNLNKIKNITRMPWETGNSWAIGIERGISGFSNYMYKKFVEGRSKEALQTKNRIRNNSFKPTNYISSMINNFVKNIEKIK
jgi:hypothetical protein